MSIDPKLAKVIGEAQAVAFKTLAGELQPDAVPVIRELQRELALAAAAGDTRAAYEYERAIESTIKERDLAKQRGRRDHVIELLKVGGRFAGAVGAAVANSYVPGSGAIVQAAVDVATKEEPRG